MANKGILALACIIGLLALTYMGILNYLFLSRSHTEEVLVQYNNTFHYYRVANGEFSLVSGSPLLVSQFELAMYWALCNSFVLHC